MFRHPVFGLVEIIPIVDYDDSVGSGLAVYYAFVEDDPSMRRRAPRCEHDWHTICSQHITEPESDYLFAPQTPTAVEVQAQICALVAEACESRAEVDLARAARYRTRAASLRMMARP